MSHLIAYEEARMEKEKALAAIEVVGHKNSKRLAWAWADTAAEHAESLGIDNALDLLGNGRWPDVDRLKETILTFEPTAKK